ncbi:dihydrolipoyl dehydrogenase family protein [Dethiosulfatarculus sandiegensis]|uniref:Dihydrolipoyl dehydrogenase n=1 Tax=Dethiosulfatarculus sandiegensis TaxID=1429043 RepID=A0A0D2J9T3_9BACT|nr:NAD(P)/FAD-dependent oxidoreductase [Dethiosulfatarculus sandiegensis]KIX14914.1 hypothetical protein X474_07130 [Dethiosulfatarculus sandiegensis]
MAEYDLIVVGAGPGGVAAAIRASQLGGKVAVVEPDKWGGLCLNRACIPTKYLSTAQERMAEFKAAPNQGFKADSQGSFDQASLWTQKSELTEYFSMGTQGLLASNGITMVAGEGRLAGPGRVAVGNEVLEGDSILISSGNKWVRPDIEGGDLDKVLNTTEFLAQDKLPQKVLFLGGGPWQLELAQFFVATGGEAFVVEEARNVLPGEDSDISQRLRSIINQGPLQILNQAKVVSLAAKGAGLEAKLEVKGETQILDCDQVVYLSREPALEGLGLDTVGLSDLTVDECQKTKASGVFAVGDVTGVDGWSHLSSAQGIVAGENVMGGSMKLNPNAIPRMCFTRPQAASVGLTEEQAEDLDYDVITGEAPMGVSPMAMIQGQSNGVFKVVAEEKYGEVLGVHILAPMATEIIGAAVLAIQMEATLEDLARACFAHPTIAESLADAARDALGWAIYQPK